MAEEIAKEAAARGFGEAVTVGMMPLDREVYAEEVTDLFPTLAAAVQRLGVFGEFAPGEEDLAEEWRAEQSAKESAGYITIYID